MNSHDVGATEIMASISTGAVVLIALFLTVLRVMLLSAAGPRTGGAKSGAKTFARSMGDIVESLILAGILVFLIIRPFFLQAFYIPSASMEKTLLGHNAGTDPVTEITYSDTVHDHLFVNKLVYRYSNPRRGDIIVFKAPLEADKQNPARGLPPVENTLIKRVVGIPGDTVSVHDGAVWLLKQNSKDFVRLQESYINEPMDDPQPDEARFATWEPLKLAAGQYFVMGDNRNHSNDGRYWGPLDRNRVIGKAAMIFLPFNRIRMLP